MEHYKNNLAHNKTHALNCILDNSFYANHSQRKLGVDGGGAGCTTGGGAFGVSSLQPPIGIKASNRMHRAIFLNITIPPNKKYNSLQTGVRWCRISYFEP
jgi:hypothetical protein